MCNDYCYAFKLAEIVMSDEDEIEKQPTCTSGPSGKSPGAVATVATCGNRVAVRRATPATESLSHMYISICFRGEYVSQYSVVNLGRCSSTKPKARTPQI